MNKFRKSLQRRLFEERMRKEKPLKELSQEELKMLLAFKLGVTETLKQQLRKEEDQIGIIRGLLGEVAEEIQARDFQIELKNQKEPATVVEEAVPLPKKVGFQLPDYDASWTWGDKFVFLLKAEDRPLLLREFVSLILKNEPQFLKYSNDLDKMKGISGRLSPEIRKGRVVKYKVQGKRAHYYLHPGWIGKDGEVNSIYLERMVFL